MTGFASAGTPSSTCTDATKQASRTRPAPDATTQQKQPAHDAVTLSDVPREFRDKWGKVAEHETFVPLRLCLQTQRSRWAPHPQVAALTPNMLDSSIAGQLNRYQRQRERWIKAVSDKHTLLAPVPWRLYLANVSDLYQKEKEARKTRKLARRNRRDRCTAKVRRASVLDEFVDFLGPELESEGVNTRHKFRNKLHTLIQCGKRWAKLIERYGTGILLLIPSSITDDE